MSIGVLLGNGLIGLHHMMNDILDVWFWTVSLLFGMAWRELEMCGWGLGLKH